jgi:hypothetical protein
MSWEKQKDGNPKVRVTKDEYDFLQQYRKLKDNAYGKVEEEGTQLTVTSKLAQSVDDIIKEYKIDTDLWECVHFKPGNWTTPVKGKFRSESENKGKVDIITATIPLMMENRKSEARFEKKTKIIDYAKFRRELVKDISRHSQKVSLKKYKNNNTGNLLEVNIPDLHLGKQSWAEETGFKNYDVKIAMQRFKDSVDEMLSKAVSEDNFERILFVVGNDLFNSDNAYPVTTTTAGTYQQDDLRWQKVFVAGRRLMIEYILKFREVAPVDVVVIPGNHDFQKSFYLGEVLESFFYNDENVNVDNSPRTRKYYQWGKCLIGLAHGNRKDEGENRLINNMKHECAKEWGETMYREWHCGDIHHYKELKQRGSSKDLDKYAEDIDGVVIKYLRTLMFNDEWEAKKGYISQKGAHMFVWNKNYGNVKEHKYNRYE